MFCTDERRARDCVEDDSASSLDGWAFAKALADRRIDVPVVVMTAARDASRWAAEIDADAYLGKPFLMEELLETVERVLRGTGR